MKLLALLLLPLFLGIVSCKKQKPREEPTPPDETPGVYESIFNLPAISYCGSALTSNLKIQDGTDIGTVIVGHDAAYLYLTYNLAPNWYLGGAEAYAGRESQIPKNVDGNPVHEQFPGRQILSYCDQRQNFTFRILLSSLFSDNSTQCSTNEQYYIAMRASVKQFSSPTDCTAGSEQPAWGAPFLINPGSATEWATAFYYCKQDCNIPAVTWCAYSQGYWFKNPNHSWCQNVKFGSLEITEQQGDTLWPAQGNWVKRALFQASAIQLSMKCVNSSNPIPASIVGDYNRIDAFLSTLTYLNIQNGTFPTTSDTTGVRASSGNIGRWICNNHCTTNPDPTACTGY
ncbi:MAG TPA: hypothetical protein VF144_18565 [Chitinophagaceae bacterium]